MTKGMPWNPHGKEKGRGIVISEDFAGLDLLENHSVCVLLLVI